MSFLKEWLGTPWVEVGRKGRRYASMLLLACFRPNTLLALMQSGSGRVLPTQTFLLTSLTLISALGVVLSDEQRFALIELPEPLSPLSPVVQPLLVAAYIASSTVLAHPGLRLVGARGRFSDTARCLAVACGGPVFICQVLTLILEKIQQESDVLLVIMLWDVLVWLVVYLVYGSILAGNAHGISAWRAVSGMVFLQGVAGYVLVVTITVAAVIQMSAAAEFRRVMEETSEAAKVNIGMALVQASCSNGTISVLVPGSLAEGFLTLGTNGIEIDGQPPPAVSTKCSLGGATRELLMEWDCNTGCGAGTHEVVVKVPNRERRIQVSCP